jgi:hypothetical protein
MFDKRPHLGLPSWFKRWYNLDVWGVYHLNHQPLTLIGEIC